LTWLADIGGLDPIISQLREAVIFPLCYPQLFDSAAGLFGAPKGVLLYGPPGCGKTMLAKVTHSICNQLISQRSDQVCLVPDSVELADP